MVRALLSIAPFSVLCVSRALKAFEDVSKKLNDQTNISLLMATTNRYYPKSTDEAVGSFVEVVDALRSALKPADEVKPVAANDGNVVLWNVFVFPKL